MPFGIPRFMAVTSALAVLCSCDKRPPLAPTAEEVALTVSTSSPTTSFDLTATAVSPTSISLVWRDNATREAGFEIHRSTAGPGGSFSLIGVTAADVTDDTDTNVLPGTQYCYRVRSFKTVGKKMRYADFSNTACAKTPTPPPSNTRATPVSSTSVDISWTDNAPTDDGFRVERSPSIAGPWEAIATTAPSVTTYRDAARTSEELRCYRVIAFNSEGESGPSNTDCTAPPLAPTNLVATVEDHGIQLTWGDNSSVESAYEVRQSNDGVTFFRVALLPANSTATRVASDGNAIRWYHVRASKDGGFSDPSNTVAAEPTGSEPTCAPFESECTNRIDDDCDGFVDGNDGDCPGCGDSCPQGYWCNEFNVCVTHCDNGIRDGDETDVDCGGLICSSCQPAGGGQ